MIEYRTIQKNGTHEIEIKKSRFICHLKRVYNEDEAKAFIEQVKKTHWKANHNCVAFQIGENNEIQRALDDGEPSGTAGVPMLEVLKQNDLKNVIAIVTRYFGGTKLGTGGLVRAYGSAVSEALKEVGIVERKLQTQIDVTLDYNLTGKFEHWLANTDYVNLNTIYLTQVTYQVGVPTGQINTFIAEVTNLTSALAEYKVGDQVYVDIPIAAHQ